MIAVIFEIFPAKGKVDEYLEIAGILRPELEKINGFISIERFYSFTEKGKVLSLSFWRDEKAIREWRNMEEHRIAQKRARSGVFSNYHLRIGAITRDYEMNHHRGQVPVDSRQVHDEAI